MHLRVEQGGGAVADVAQRYLDAAPGQFVYQVAKQAVLAPGESGVDGSGEVGVDTLEVQRRKQKFVQHSPEGLRCKPGAPHSGLDLQVHCHLLTAIGGCGGQTLRLGQRADRRGQAELDDGLFLARQQWTEDQDGSGDSGLPQQYPVFGMSHPEHGRPIGDGDARCRDQPVAIAVGFDYGQQPHLRRQQPLHRGHVAGDGVQVNLYPARSACIFVFQLIHPPTRYAYMNSSVLGLLRCSRRRVTCW